MRLIPWQSWRRIVHYSPSPYGRRVARAIPRVSPSSPQRGADPTPGTPDRCGMRERDGAAPRVSHSAGRWHRARARVIKWNQLLRRILLIPGAQPPTIGGGRSLAMPHCHLRRSELD